MEAINNHSINRIKQLPWKHIAIIAGAVLMVLLFFFLFITLRHYDEHEIIDSANSKDTAATTYAEFAGNLLKYSNDGALYTDSQGNLIWNQTYEMDNPMVDISEKYVAIADKGGTTIHVMDANGLCGSIDTMKPISQVDVANQGTVAVLLVDKQVGYLKLYDKEGKNLAEGELHAKNSGYPLDIALSHDGKKLVTSVLDIQDGSIKTTLTFYNFTKSGQKKMDNIMDTKTYKGTVIPMIEFVGNDRMFALTESKMIFFDAGQKIKKKKEIKFESRLRSFFYNEEYYGMIFDNEDSKHPEKIYCLKIYDKWGARIRKKAFEYSYDKAEFMENGEVCLINDNECTIITQKGVIKYHEAWEQTIYKVMPGETFRRYLFLLQGEKTTVKLK